MGLVRKNTVTNYNYFDEFEKNANCSLECAKIVAEILENFNQKNNEQSLKKIHEVENRGDKGKHDMTNYLVKDFLPPIEREDILILSQKIDDLTDSIEEILINIDMFNVTKIKPETKEFTELLVEACNNEYKLIELFKNFKQWDKIHEKVITSNGIEEKGDKLFIQTMRNLYRDGTETLEVLKWTTIYNCFEDCFDLCENIANEIENIVLKNM